MRKNARNSPKSLRFVAKIPDMQRVASRLNKLSESQTLAMTRISREMRAKGIDVISLSIGEPDFDTPDYIKTAAKKAIDENFTHYPPVAGIPELREAVCVKLKRDNHLEYQANQIVISTGAKQSLANVILSLVDEGDEVIVPIPYWVSYIELIKLADGIPVFIPSGVEQDFKITAQQLKAAITPATRMVMLNSPGNPSGAVYSKQEMDELVAVLVQCPNVLVLSDEIYEYINFSGEHFSPAQNEALKDRVIIVNGVSKGYAMTGWRIGYIAAPRWIAEACEKMQGQITSGTCSIAQKAAVDALLAPREKISYMQEGFLKRRDLCLKLIAEIPYFKTPQPDGAFYLFPHVAQLYGKKFNGTEINNSHDLCMYFLNEAHVALVSGDAFGDGECLRISYATSEEKLIEAMSRLKNAVLKLQ
jgi:aspartate aminotransferase